MKRLPGILMLCVAMLFLPGCWDKVELEDMSYVVAIGIDKGKNNLLNVTLQVENPQVGSSEKAQAQGEPPSLIVTFPASDLASVTGLANASVTRKITYSQTRTIVVSQELAKTELFNKIIVAAMRGRQFRREINLIVSKEKASEFINANKPKMETRPHKFYDFIQERWKDTGLVPVSTLERFFQRTDSGDTLFLGIYATARKNPKEGNGHEDEFKAGEIQKKGGDPVQMIGSAVFKNGKMIGTITGEETRLILLLRKKSIANNWISTYPDPLDSKQSIAVNLIRYKKPSIKVHWQGSHPTIDENVPLTMQLLSIPSQIDYVLDQKKQAILKDHIEEDLAKKAEKFIQKTQKQLKGDPFLYDHNIRRHFGSWKAFKEFNWSKTYPSVPIYVKFDVTIEDIGKTVQPPDGGKHEQ